MAVVLMQSSKGSGLAGSIGGSSMTMAFGVRRTSDILTKATTVLATSMLVLCILVNLMIGSGETEGESVIQREAGQQQVPTDMQQPPPQQQIPGDDQQQQEQQQEEGQPEQEQAPGN